MIINDPQFSIDHQWRTSPCFDSVLLPQLLLAQVAAQRRIERHDASHGGADDILFCVGRKNAIANHQR